MSEEEQAVFPVYQPRHGPVRNPEYLQDTIRARARRGHLKIIESCNGPDPEKCQHGRCEAMGVCMEYPNHLWKLNVKEGECE